MMIAVKLFGKVALPWVPTGLAVAVIRIVEMKDWAQFVSYTCAAICSLAVAWSALNKNKKGKK